MVEMPDRRRETLEAEIKAFIRPGTRIMSHGWAAYNKVEELAGGDYNHSVISSRTSARGHPRSDARFSSVKVADAQIRLSDGIPVISDRSTHEILSEILLLATKRIRSLRTP
eukprot:snap_masked-scaffold319_size207808-processed-gene-1.5 protein:Tk00374 transcript:snap_masked-scaffold319_size207808-processed-gene-1.5-mRNA-1 annotation:"hypothetical protein ASU_11156"